LIDQSVKKKWGATKDGKGKTAVLIAPWEKELQDLNQIINSATNELAEQVERYDQLSLSGSLSAQVGSAIRLLEQHYRALENKGMDPNQLQKVKESLDLLKRKLDLLNSAKGQA
jgi:CCR4-NOT transcriptional regulation complex NOT5 subunit